MRHPAILKYHALVDGGQLEQSPWLQADEKSKAIASARTEIVQQVAKLETQQSLNTALRMMLEHINTEQPPLSISQALSVLPKKPGKSTLRNWVKAYEAEGRDGLLPSYKGKNRKEYGWEAKALELYHKSSKPSLAKVARDLTDDHGYTNADEHNVRYFFKSLPAELQDKSPWRMGQKLYRDGMREHVMRTTENLPVGFLFQGDGHCIDVYLKHPRTGKIWRAELVVWMDVKSRYIVGWYLCVAESSINTMAALSHAIGSFDHVPAMVHVDHGSGFKSKMMNDETAGFYASFGIEPLMALPGNAKSKNVERWFRTLEDDFGKDFDTYCGYDQSGDTSKNFSSAKLAKLEAEGKVHVPTVDEWKAEFERWLEKYHHRPHPEFKDETPASMWATLEPVKVHDQNLLVKPRQRVKVHRSLVTLHGRKYRAEFLYQFNDKELIAEYDLHDDSAIRLFDENGVWLTTAYLKSKADYIPTSRIEEAEQKRLKAQIKRLDNHANEKRAQADRHIDVVGNTNHMLDNLSQSINQFDQEQAPANDEDKLLTDLTQDLMQQPATEKTSSQNDTLDLLDLLDNAQ